MGKNRIAGICGIAIPVVLVTSIVSAISISPWFSFTQNALSDLGVHSESDIIFNSGLIIAGLLTAVLGVGLLGSLKGTIGKTAALLLIVEGLSLSGIGIFPETAGRIHFYLFVVVFVLFPLSSLTMGVHFFKIGRSKLAVAAIAILVVTAVPWVFSWEGVAIPESISGGTASGWLAVLGYKLYQQKLP